MKPPGNVNPSVIASRVSLYGKCLVSPMKNDVAIPNASERRRRLFISVPPSFFPAAA